MKTLTLLFISVFSMVVWIGCTQGDKTIQLKYKFTDGQRLVYSQKNHRKVKVVEGDSTIYEQTSTFDAAIDQSVTEVINDSTATILEVMAWSWESERKENDSVYTDTLSRERRLILTMFANGKVSDLRYANGEEHGSLAYIKNYYEQGMPVFPASDISPGQSWSQSTKVILPNETMEASTTYKVRALARESGYDCAVIEYDGNLIIPVEPKAEDSTSRGGIDRIKSTGVIYFAYTEGFVVMQRERWVIDGVRRKVENGIESQYRMAVELDAEFVLIERNTGSE